MKHMDIRSLLAFWLLLLVLGAPLRAQVTPTPLARMNIDVPDFEPYQAEYTSAFGRFLHEAWPYALDGRPKVGVVNTIVTPEGVIVDSRSFDRGTLHIDYMTSPYFAWGQEYVVALFQGSQHQWTRVPLGGGEPVVLRATSEDGPLVDDLGFSPAFASLLPLEVGTSFSMPVPRPLADGTVGSALMTFEVVGTEHLSLASGYACDCTVLEQKGPGESVTRFWVSREAPFVFRRHRDVGGQRDFVSDLLGFQGFDLGR
ncbi:MAG: hypothetical protein AAF389_18090 [Gemmatimonadota bacterium]